MNSYFKKAPFVRKTQFFMTRDETKAFLETNCWNRWESIFVPIQFCACYVRKCFINKLLSFPHIDGLSMSVNDEYVRMSSCGQLWYDLERRATMSLGQTLLEFPLPRLRERHMLPSSDTISGSLGQSAEGCAFLTYCCKYSSLYCVFETRPNCQTEWNGGRLLQWCVFILSPLS